MHSTNLDLLRLLLRLLRSSLSSLLLSESDESDDDEEELLESDESESESEEELELELLLLLVLADLFLLGLLLPLICALREFFFSFSTFSFLGAFDEDPPAVEANIVIERSLLLVRWLYGVVLRMVWGG